MTIEIKGTRNYSATVIKVPKVRKAENSDRLYIIDALGITAIVDESWIAREGELALLFPAEVQLSHEFAAANGLYRQSLELNTDRNDAGYLEANRRVRALKLRGNISNGLVLPLEVALGNIGLGLNHLEEGAVFDHIMQKEICRKYVVPMKEGAASGHSQVAKAFKRVDNTYLPEHFETGQWLREQHTVDDRELLVITQKLHGTSVRLANTIVKRQLTKREKFAKRFLGADIADHGYDLVAGSRKAIKDPNNPNQADFYGTDIWTHALGEFGDKIPKNFVVYGELVGYVPGTETPIQKGHTYDLEVGKYELYVYRVAVITEDADLVDLSWSQVKAFCKQHGLKNVPELIVVRKGLLWLDTFEERDFWKTYQELLAKGYEHVAYNEAPVRLSEGGTGKDEGVAIRVEDGLEPRLFKFKNKSHYLYESGELDSGEVDLESQG